jgi:hypothetical protein
MIIVRTTILRGTKKEADESNEFVGGFGSRVG